MYIISLISQQNRIQRRTTRFHAHCQSIDDRFEKKPTKHVCRGAEKVRVPIFRTWPAPIATQRSFCRRCHFFERFSIFSDIFNNNHLFISFQNVLFSCHCCKIASIRRVCSNLAAWTFCCTFRHQSTWFWIRNRLWLCRRVNRVGNFTTRFLTWKLLERWIYSKFQYIFLTYIYLFSL